MSSDLRPVRDRSFYCTKTRHTFCGLVALALSFALPIHAAELNDADRAFLASYEKVRAALAADDLSRTKAAAGEMHEDGAAIARADKIATARAEFAKLSDRAIELANGQSGYYVVNCPMLKKDWVQTSKEISNPYAGKEMLTCGVVKK